MANQLGGGAGGQGDRIDRRDGQRRGGLHRVGVRSAGIPAGGELVDQRNVGFEQLSVRGKRAQHGRNAVGILLFHAPFSLLSIQRRARAKASPVSSHSMKGVPPTAIRSEEHTSELQSLMRISYAVFCLKKKNTTSK